jgi:hypothetical protein
MNPDPISALAGPFRRCDCRLVKKFDAEQTADLTHALRHVQLGESDIIRADKCSGTTKPQDAVYFARPTYIRLRFDQFEPSAKLRVEAQTETVKFGQLVSLKARRPNIDTSAYEVALVEPKTGESILPLGAGRKCSRNCR